MKEEETILEEFKKVVARLDITKDDEAINNRRKDQLNYLIGYKAALEFALN